MAETELGGSALPSMGRREKGLETEDEHFLFPRSLGSPENKRKEKGPYKV